jgi:hypothetical protein
MRSVGNVTQQKRTRRVRSVTDELLHKSREAALAAVQIYNNPQILFKSELFITTMCVAWTYLLHSYYRKNGVEYRYYSSTNNGRRRFDRTKHGAYKHWELERCINDDLCPLDTKTCKNLRFLIGLRHEIEHQMTTRIDDSQSAKFQSCCLNYNRYIKELFGDGFAIDRHLAFSLQFSSIEREQADVLLAAKDLPRNIQAFISAFEGELTQEEFNSPQFAYRVLFIPKTANRKGQADQVIEFVKADSSIAREVNQVYIKETERPKYLPGQIVKMMQAEGYDWFNMTSHTNLWKTRDARNPAKGYGAAVAGGYWYWYSNWLDEVRAHCVAENS